MAGAITYFEIHADDPQRAMAFYRDTFGWTTNDVPGMDQQYWLLFPTGESPEEVASGGVSKGIGGGMMVRRGPRPADGAPVNAFVCIIEVDDVASIERAIPANGGVIALPAMDVAGVGRVLYGKDTEGNLFGVLQPAPRPA